MRILIVEDHLALGRTVVDAFCAKGHAVDWVQTGEDADAALMVQPYDLVILDLGLPDMDGIDLLRSLRQRKSRVPVLILTARDSLHDRVEGLNRGADDYLVKPFDLEELEARAAALIRRGVGGSSSVLTLGRLSVDTLGRIVRLDGEVLELPRRELCLLELLILRAGQVVAKQAILEELFSMDEEPNINVVELYIHRLRKKLEPAQIHIRTIRGLGYLLESV